MGIENKKYYVEVDQIIHKTSYQDGEGEFVNEFTETAQFDAPTPKEALSYIMRNILVSDTIDVDKLEMNENNQVELDVLVDNDNYPVDTDSEEYAQWKEGRITLYNMHLIIDIYELHRVTKL